MTTASIVAVLRRRTSTTSSGATGRSLAVKSDRRATTRSGATTVASDSTTSNGPVSTNRSEPSSAPELQMRAPTIT